MQTIRQTMETAAALGTGTELLLPHVELHADRRVVVDGCSGIVALDDSAVKLNCGVFLLTLRGAGLCVEELSGEHLSVSGTLAALELSSL